MVADSQYVEEYRVRVVEVYNAVGSCFCRKYDPGTSLRDKAFQIEVQYCYLTIP